MIARSLWRCLTNPCPKVLLPVRVPQALVQVAQELVVVLLVQVLVDRAQDDQEHKAEPHRLTPSSPS